MRAGAIAFGLVEMPLRRAGCVGVGRLDGARVVLRPGYFLIQEVLEVGELRALGETTPSVEADAVERELWDNLVPRLRRMPRKPLAKVRSAPVETPQTTPKPRTRARRARGG